MLFNFARIVKRIKSDARVASLSQAARVATPYAAIALALMLVVGSPMTAIAQDTGVVNELESIFTPGNGSHTPIVAVAPFEHRFKHVGIGVAEVVAREIAISGGGSIQTVTQPAIADALASALLDGKKLYSSRRSLNFAKMANIDYLIVGCVSELGIVENNPAFWEWSLKLVFGTAVVARIRLDYALVNVSENRVV